jgi:hypothetical protein
MKTFRELESEQKLYIEAPEGGWCTQSFQNMDALRNSFVTDVKLPMIYRRRRVQLEMWVVIGSEAVVITGPKKWLPQGIRWFCFSDYEICGVLIPQIESLWGSKAGDDPGILDDMLRLIPRDVRLPATPLYTPPSGTSWGPIAPGLNLV